MSKDSSDATKAAMAATTAPEAPADGAPASADSTPEAPAAEGASDGSSSDATPEAPAAESAEADSSETATEAAPEASADGATEIEVSEEDPEAAQAALDQQEADREAKELEAAKKLAESFGVFAQSAEEMDATNADLRTIIDGLSDEVDDVTRERDQFAMMLRLPASSSALDKLRAALVGVSSTVETSRKNSRDASKPYLEKYAHLLNKDAAPAEDSADDDADSSDEE